MTSQTIGAGRKACQASLANFLSFGKAAPSDGMQPTLVTEWIQESKGVSSSSSISQLLPHPQRSAKARGSLRIDPRPGYQSEVNDTHHARSRNLSPSRVISRLRGNTRYSI